MGGGVGGGGEGLQLIMGGQQRVTMILILKNSNSNSKILNGSNPSTKL